MFIALSLFLPYLFGLGYLVTSAAPGMINATLDRKQDTLRMIAVILLTGVLSDYLLVLVLGKLGFSLVIGSVLALIGLSLALFTSHIKVFRFLKNKWIAVCVVFYLTLLYSRYIIFEPLSAWDARSIWFFHGKIIFYDQALSSSAGWTDSAIQFSRIHIGYPKLIAVLAAQFAHVTGFWNEYFPKASLLALLIPALFAIQSFIRFGQISFFYLLSCLLFSLSWWLWNGYMDGYLALYGALSMLFFGRWLEQRDNGDLYAGIVCLGIVVNLKNEGLLFVLTTTFVVIALRYARSEEYAPEISILRDHGTWSLIVLSSIGLIIWYLLKWHWGINSESFIQLNRIPVRLADGSVKLILETMLLKDGVAKAFVFFLIVLFVAKRFHLRMPLSSWLALLISFLYFSGIFTVYLATSLDLVWHLSTSSGRTMLPVLLGIFSATFLLVKSIESSDDKQSIPSQDALIGRRQN